MYEYETERKQVRLDRARDVAVERFTRKWKHHLGREFHWRRPRGSYPGFNLTPGERAAASELVGFYLNYRW